MKTPAGGLFRMTTATGLALLLLLSIPPSCAARHMPDWSRVQAVPPKTKTDVHLYKDEAHQGSRKIKGRFDSAEADSITLKLKDGQTRTLEKSAVRKVLTRRPFAKRWPGWVALGTPFVLEKIATSARGIAPDCQGRSKFGPLRRSKSRPVGEGVAVFVGRLERSLRSPFRAAQA